MPKPMLSQSLHDELAEILAADEILSRSALAPWGAEGEGECAVHDGCRPIG